MSAKQIKKILSATSNKPLEYIHPAEENGEEEVILIFDKNFDSSKHHVVKLALTGLPLSHDGKPVAWIANFGIKHKDKDTYVDHTYTVIVKPRPGFELVVYDGAKDQIVSANSQRATGEHSGKIAITLSIGDPGVGWVG